MVKFLLFFYIVTFSIYILFTRQPDWFESEVTQGIIQKKPDGSFNAAFVVGSKTFEINPAYLFLHFKENQKIKIIYEPAKPQYAKVYSFWGYWLTFKELIFSICILLAGFFIAKTITANPENQPEKEGEDYE